MTRFRYTVAAFCALFLAATSLVTAELSASNAAWADGPVKFLFTKDEMKQWKGIDSDADAKNFIELFWARRNPAPDESFNEFKSTFEGAVRYADEKFGYDENRGALTDRAKVIILLGIPHQAERRGPTETVQRMGNEGVSSGQGTDEVRTNAEMWTYEPVRLPEGFEAKGSRLLFVFYEEKLGSNNFVLDRSHREATMSMRVLSKAPAVYFLHPEMMEVAKPISVPGGQAATSEQLAWLDGPALPHTAEAIAEAGVADATHRPLWLQLTLPAEAPDLDLLVGRLTNPSGEVLSNFSVAATPLSVNSGSAYHLTFPVGPGTYQVEVAGVASSMPQTRIDETVTIEPIPLEGTWMSPLWTGITAEREEEAPLGSAYTFGGWHLRPMTEGPVDKNNQLSYFGFIVRPGSSEDGQPSLRVKIVLKKDGKRLGQPLRLPLAAAPVATDLYLYANALNLAPFPAGDFEFEFTIQDTVSKTKVKRTVKLTLTE